MPRISKEASLKEHSINFCDILRFNRTKIVFYVILFYHRGKTKLIFLILFIQVHCKIYNIKIIQIHFLSNINIESKTCANFDIMRSHKSKNEIPTNQTGSFIGLQPILLNRTSCRRIYFTAIEKNATKCNRKVSKIY